MLELPDSETSPATGNSPSATGDGSDVGQSRRHDAVAEMLVDKAMIMACSSAVTPRLRLQRICGHIFGGVRGQGSQPNPMARL